MTKCMNEKIDGLHEKIQKCAFMILWLYKKSTKIKYIYYTDL